MMSSLLSQKSTVFTAANPFEVSEYVNLHAGNHRLWVPGKSHGTASLSHRKAASLDFCRLSYGTQAHVMSDGLADMYHVQFILRGHCRYDVGSEALSLCAGHVMLINPDEPIDLTYSEDCEKFIVRVGAQLFDEACIEHRWFKRNERVKFNAVPYRFEELNGLLQLLQLVCEEAESATTTPQLLQHYSRVVTSKLMAVLKHNVSLAQPGLHNVCFERIVQYIEENIKCDISPEALAQFSKLSLRSLYTLFEKYARTTPKNFVRQKKLEHVHAALSTPNSNVANVTAIALDYGFSHLGRFSEIYKSSFGMLPSETLKGRQGSH